MQALPFFLLFLPARYNVQHFTTQFGGAITSRERGINYDYFSTSIVYNRSSIFLLMDISITMECAELLI